MANSPSLAKPGRSTAKFGDLRRRAMFLLLALIVYRIGAHIPVPGIDPDQLAKLFQSQAGGILGMFNMFSGGALSRFTIFALGIMPYISASIIMQLLAIVSPQLEALKKEGQAGQRKITQYTRYFTVVLATFQAFGIAAALENQPGLVIDPGMLFRLTTVVTLVTGTMFLMWLGEQITERGLGNGISIIIFGGIAAGFPNAVGGLFELVRTGSMSIISAIIIVVLIAAVTYLVVFIERGQRKILVNYAKRQVGNKIYGGQSSHLPLKLNMSGVIPPIFASSIILFPATILGWFSTGQPTGSWISNTLHNVAEALKPGQPVYVLLYTLAIVFFLLLLHRTGVQQQGNRGQPEEERRVCSGYSTGRSDRTIYRPHPHASDAGWCDLHRLRVSAAGIPGAALERAVLFWWNVAADHCRRHDGLHGAGAVVRYVATV